MAHSSLMVVALSAALLTACAGQALPPEVNPAVVRAIEDYYERHASEVHGYCFAPYISGVSKAEIVEKDADRLVIDVRYLFQDRIKDDRGDGGFLGRCAGFRSRRFVLDVSGEKPMVIEMGGDRRTPPTAS